VQYDIIIPIIPGNHIDGWEKIRKSQWKFVRRVLSEQLDIRGETLKSWKYFYTHYFEEMEEEGLFEYYPLPLLEFWFCPDQSEKMWSNLWDAYQSKFAKRSNYKEEQMLFFNVAGNGLKDDNHKALDYGAFGGLEQRLLDVFLTSKTYTDDTINLAGKDYRKVPWETPYLAYCYVVGGMTEPFETNCYDEGDVVNPISPFSPYQWLHEMVISTFDYDFHSDKKYSDDRGMISCCKSLKKSLSDNISELVHPNHIVASHKLIDIFEDDMAPSHVRDLWIKVRDDKNFSDKIILG